MHSALKSAVTVRGASEGQGAARTLWKCQFVSFIERKFVLAPAADRGMKIEGQVVDLCIAMKPLGGKFHGCVLFLQAKGTTQPPS